MKLEDMMKSIKGNLGNRASGLIGGENVDTVVLRAINTALPQCVKLSNPTAYEKQINLSMGPGFANPSQVLDANGRGVKDILYVRCHYYVSLDAITIVHKPFADFLKLTETRDQVRDGVPSIYALQGGSLYINRVPEEVITMSLYCEIWPRDLTTQDLDFPMGVGPEWDLAIEAFATHYCYAKLQQLNVSEYWKLMYEDQKKINTQVKRKSTGRGMDTPQQGRSGNDHLNPFVSTNRG